MKTTKSIEDYLEAIYLLSLKKEPVRIRDIAAFLSVKLPSVTEAVSKLLSKRLAKHSPYGDVTLTKKGKAIGKETWSKHQIIYRFLKNSLGVPEDKAFEEACLIEHFISNETKEKLKKFLEK